MKQRNFIDKVQLLQGCFINLFVLLNYEMTVGEDGQQQIVFSERAIAM